MRTVKELIGRGTGVIAIAASILSGGCQATVKENGLQIQRIIAGVTDASGTIHASLVQGDAPNPNGGPTNTASGFAAMVTGGSSQQTLTGSGAFTRIVVAMPGARNYYELTVPSGTTTPIILRAAENLSSMNMGVSYAVGDANVIGKYTEQTVRIIYVGNGDVQVSVSWSDTSDVDLHVVDPALEEVYFGHRSAASGGTLDLDSNAACGRDDLQFPHKSNENIVWPVGHAPHGSFTVRLAYWSACNVSAPTDYVVTVATKGGGAQVFTGQFTGSGTGGGAGSGTLITTFTF
ncbi:MAG TPA: hypothetical protein VLK88_03400 [Gemmatimonadales bacterium]|nr:hypothetical protein [Gemmatimonadales bacterium]